MKTYVVEPSPSKAFSAVVYATGTARPTEELGRLAKELKKKRVNGNVLFDLLVPNGVRSRRYLCAKFDGSTFDQAKWSSVEASAELRAASSRFFVDHIDELDTSMLTPAVRFALQRGLVL